MTKQFVDLHTHSYRSDGTVSPEALVVLAKRIGLSAIALTDHDTIDGLAEFMEAGKKHDIETIAGIEMACTYEKFHQPEIHIVGLGFDPDSPHLTGYLAALREERKKRNLLMLAKLCDLGFDCTLEELHQTAGGRVVTRAHFGTLLFQKGYVKDRNEAFQKYIGNGCPAFLPRNLPTPKDVIAEIHNAGGVAILAHPTLYKLDFGQLDALCKEFVSYGLDGIECYYSTYTPNQRKAVLKLAKKHKLLPSGGSDFHGENKPDIQLGIGMGHLEVEYGCWQNLKTKDSSSLYSSE
ncbi:PHP domain-containing protein [Chakrabartyella piscis]|uniref:PHP domain-containing protein n=1 Tax=Chakrabartyella piscis TaxID=2918914 RepID=UPI0029583ACA|nr:PHP domain-containing protein [Chakrabartyella piscis]